MILQNLPFFEHFIILLNNSSLSLKAFATREISAAGARCLGDKHNQTIARQREALVELRNKVKDLEQFRPPSMYQMRELRLFSCQKCKTSYFDLSECFIWFGKFHIRCIH